MAHKHKSRKRKWIVPLIIVGLVVVPAIIFYAVIQSVGPKDVGEDTCEFGEVISPYCEGEGSNKVYRKICNDSVWVVELVEVCSATEQCVLGNCYPSSCSNIGDVPPTCINEFEKLVPICDGGKLKFERQVCGIASQYGSQEIKAYCKEGSCVQQPVTCGDGICQSTEDQTSCYRDCSVINSAQAYSQEVSDNIGELGKYLACDNDFDCKNPAVIQMADSLLNKYNIPDGNPQMYMDAVISYVNKYILYDFGGGNYQCGESASAMIQKKWGNCVDYSILSISLLRAKGIPARQVAGCVSHKGWFCHTFALRDQSKFGGVPILWQSEAQRDSANDNVVGGDILGHSWIEVWLGKEKGWVTADPTVGSTISKKCLGYYPVQYGGNGDAHKDCEGLFGQQPCYTSAYCHINGDDVIAYCRDY